MSKITNILNKRIASQTQQYKNNTSWPICAYFSNTDLI